MRSIAALNRRAAFLPLMLSRLTEPRDLLIIGKTRTNGNLASTPYPANSGGKFLIFIQNSVLGGINPSASRAGLRRVVDNSRSHKVMKSDDNLQSTSELFAIHRIPMPDVS